MSQPARARPSLDFEDLERELQSAVTSSSPPRTPAADADRPPADRRPLRSSPAVAPEEALAELARIVGQTDPYARVFRAADGASSAPRSAPHADEPETLRAPTHERVARRDRDDDRGDDAHGGPIPTLTDAWDPHLDSTADDEPEEVLPPEPKPSRRPLLIAGGLVAVALLGGLAAVTLKGMGRPTDGAPPTVQANTTPVRVQPPPSATAEANGGAVLDRSSGRADTASRVVDREEQPTDVEATRRAAEAARLAAGVPSQTVLGSLGEPRRVKTVSIRPDGTVVRDGAAASPAPAVPAAPSLASVPGAPAPVAAPRPPAEAVEPARAARTPASPAARTSGDTITNATSTRPAPRPAPAAPPAAEPVAEPPARTAAVRPAPAEPAAAEPAAESGSAVVQLAAAGSDAEARATFTRLQRQFGELSGFAPRIQTAEVRGSTIYRVRVGPVPRERANEICTAIKRKGGSCFVP